MFRLVVVFGFLGFGACFLERISGVFQTFAYRPFGSLSSVLNSLAGCLRPMLDCLACLDGSLLDGFASFSDGILVLRKDGKGQAKAQRNC